MTDELNNTNVPDPGQVPPQGMPPVAPPPAAPQPPQAPPTMPIAPGVPGSGPVVPPGPVIAPVMPPAPLAPPPAAPPVAQPPAQPTGPPAWPAGAPQAPPPIVPPAAPAPQAPPLMQPPAQAPVQAPPAPPAPPAQLPVPPVPAAAAPIEDEPAKKVPLWKREIGGGKKDKKKGKGKQETAPAELPPAATAAAPDAPAKVPFWKLEVGGKKKAKKSKGAVAAEAVTAAVPAPAEAPQKTPFWKLELGGGKKKKGQALEETLVQAPLSPLPGLVDDQGIPVDAVAPKQSRFKLARKKAPLVESNRQEIVLAPEPKAPWYKRDVGGGEGKEEKKLKSVIGLKVGASQIAAARIINDGGTPELVQLARERLERGIVVGGELRDPLALANALGEFFKKHHLPKKNVRLGVANNRVNVRILDIAGAAMSPKQLENAIRFRAQEALPIPIDDAVLDYQVLSQTVNAEGELVHRVLVVVAYRDLIDRYVEACRKAGIRLIGIDLEAFALVRALVEPSPPQTRSDAAQVVVSVGHDRSTFAVSDGAICEFTRVLDWGGSALDIAIARQLNLTPSEAEPIKCAVSLDGVQRELPELVTADQVTQAAEVVRRQLQTFARELVSSLQFYQNQPGSLGIGEIVITGGTAQMPGLASELQRLIGVVVRVGDPVGRVVVGKRVRNIADAGSLAIAIGLGIEL